MELGEWNEITYVVNLTLIAHNKINDKGRDKKIIVFLTPFYFFQIRKEQIPYPGLLLDL